MQDDGLHFGPRLYDEDEVSSADERFDSNESADFGLEGGDMAPHERFIKEQAQKDKNKLNEARLNAIGDDLASTIGELREAADVAQLMRRALRDSRNKTMERLVEFEGTYKGVSNMAQQYSDMFDYGIADCTKKVTAVNKQVNDLDWHLNSADSLVEALESVRGVTLLMDARMEPMEQLARRRAENAQWQHLLEVDIDKILAAQRQFRAFIDRPPTQFGSTTWNASVASEMARQMSNVRLIFARLHHIIDESEEARECNEFSHQARLLASAIADIELPILIAEPGGTGMHEMASWAELSTYSTQHVTSSASKPLAAEPPHTDHSALPTHLSYSAESFKSALEKLPEANATSSKIQVEITESETRPMFAPTTVTEDKDFVNPEPQSPMCPTARHKSADSVVTADVQPSEAAQNTCDTDTADCRTACEITGLLSSNADESLVEPLASVLTALEESMTSLSLKTATARGTRSTSSSAVTAASASLDSLVSMLTARGLSVEDLRTALTTTTTPTRTARWADELNTECTQNDVSFVGTD
ncbi:unnamed protein product, partial [Mesorhabditis spiculigera]